MESGSCNKPLKLRASGRIRFKTALRGCVTFAVMRWRGWVEVPEDSEHWDIYWADVQSIGVDSGFNHSLLKDHQKLNHFPRHHELTRKDLMVKNLKKAKKQLDKQGRGQELAFFPQTFSLPQDYGLFAEEFRQNGGVWIVKPCGRAQGKGIFLLDKLSQVNAWKKRQDAGLDEKEREVFVVSRYLERPLLIGGKKFDLRIFALVLSYSPLVVYLHSSSRYSLHKQTMKDLHTHLTNVAVQKKSENYDPTTGMKWPLRSFRLFIIARHGRQAAQELFQQIQMVVIRSFMAVQDKVTQDKHSFELYGFDVLVDDHLKPWLIEVNAMPSLYCDTPADFQLKFSMVDAALTLVDVEQKLGGQLPHTLEGFDLVCRAGQIVLPATPGLGCQLGCSYELTPHMPQPTRRKRKPKKADGTAEASAAEAAASRMPAAACVS